MEHQSKAPKLKFYNGEEIPIIGLGTWRSSPGEVGQAVKDAIDIGYRHIDNGYLYGNEKEVGEAIRSKIAEGVVTREDIFVNSKLWNTFHRPEAVEPALRTTLKNLGLEYLDMYLVHWPIALKEGSELNPVDENGKVQFADYDYVDTWKAMEKVQEKGLVKNIGVSNFNEEQLASVLKVAKIKPVVNQVECQPHFAQFKLSEYCKSNGIALEAYRPLGGPDRKLLDDQKIIDIGKKYNKSSAQILLRYQVQRGHVSVPKSVNKHRIQENIDIFDFELSNDDMDLMKSFDSNRRIVKLLDCIDSPYYPFEK